MTWRRLLVLVDHFPPESATSTAIRNSASKDELAERRGDGTKAPWSATELLLAQLIDAVRINTWVYAQSKSKSKLPKPDPIPRPGMDAGPGRRRMSIDQIKELDPRLRGLPDDIAAQEYEKMTGRKVGQ